MDERRALSESERGRQRERERESAVERVIKIEETPPRDPLSLHCSPS